MIRDFSSSDESGESGEEQVKSIKINAEFWLV